MQSAEIGGVRLGLSDETTRVNSKEKLAQEYQSLVVAAKLTRKSMMRDVGTLEQKFEVLLNGICQHKGSDADESQKKHQLQHHLKRLYPKLMFSELYEAVGEEEKEVEESSEEDQS